MNGNNDCESNAAPTCTVVGFLLGLAAASSYVFVTITPCWYVSYAEASISPYENCYGLWKFCSSTGLCGKWLSGSLLGAHGAQRIVCRGLMITACLLAFVALLLNVLGMKCVLLFTLSLKTKEKLTRWSALVWVLSGTFALVASTWYGLDVINSAWDEGKAMELSDGIFVGWGSVAFSYTAAVFLWAASAVWRRLDIFGGQGRKACNCTLCRERKRAAKRRDSVLATVAAAYVASRSGSGVSVGCCCQLPVQSSGPQSCSKHPSSNLQTISEMPFIERPHKARDVTFAGHTTMTYM